MEFHIKCKPEEVSRYVFCPGSQRRAKRIAEQFDEMRLVNDSRGIVVYSGTYKGIPLTSCGTGMGGPVVAICMEELSHLGADTFVRVGSCGVFQDGQQPGDIIIATGTIRAGGTSRDYLPIEFPAVPTYEVLRTLVDTAEALDIPYTTGVGIAGDAFYGPREPWEPGLLKQAGIVSVEMESDTLFTVGQYRGLRTGAMYASDGTNQEIKPEWGEEQYLQGEKDMITVALEAMVALAKADAAG
jgi:DeoD family purine-nucleoside phosphorylase